MLKTIYAKGYTFKEGPYTSRGTEYYKDRSYKHFICRDPYKAIRRNQVVVINGVSYLAVVDLNMPVTYHREPTKSEIAFGEGATHFRDFELADVLNKDGIIKKWLVAKDDGLRYYR